MAILYPCRIAILIIMFESLISSVAGGGMFGAGGLMGGESETPSASNAYSGGPFTSGAVTMGGGGVNGGIGTSTILIVGAVALIALFLFKGRK